LSIALKDIPERDEDHSKLALKMQSIRKKQQSSLLKNGVLFSLHQYIHDMEMRKLLQNIMKAHIHIGVVLSF
jgi:hypothetical protein